VIKERFPKLDVAVSNPASRPIIVKNLETNQFLAFRWPKGGTCHLSERGAIVANVVLQYGFGESELYFCSLLTMGFQAGSLLELNRRALFTLRAVPS
jgi:hypothetical protein